MNPRILFVALAVAIIQDCAFAFSMNDCILEGMKGVSSDIAARMVKQACEEKANEARQKNVAALVKEFGDPIAPESVSLAANYSRESGRHVSIQATNNVKNGDQTIRYIKLSVAPVEDGFCATWKRTVFAYKLTLTPGSSIKLQASAPNTEDVCFEILAVRGTSAGWSDFSIAGTIEPMGKDPFADAFPERRAPAPAPAAAPAPLPAPIPTGLSSNPSSGSDSCRKWIQLRENGKTNSPEYKKYDSLCRQGK